MKISKKNVARKDSACSVENIRLTNSKKENMAILGHKVDVPRAPDCINEAHTR
jgi:hypothetical protein